MDLATLFVRFKADTSDVDKGVKQLESNTKKSGDNIAKTLAAAFSAAVIAKGIKSSIDAASDLNETVSKTEVIFGSSSAAIEKQGDTAAKSMGLSKRAYLDAASGLKGLLDNLGLTQDASTKYAQSLTGLGSDLASFFNTKPEDAIAALSAALRGETEPLRAYNVQLSDATIKAEAMKEGLYNGTGAIDASAKAQATLALIMQQTTAAQGDFARTADGAANSQRIAAATAEDSAASFGQVLLPVYTKVVQIVTTLVDVFGNLPGPVQTALIALVGLVAISGPLGSLIEVVGSIKTALSGLSLSAGGIGLIAAAVAGLAIVLSDSDDSAAQVSARAKEVAGNLATETAEIVKQAQATGKGVTATQSYADAQEALSNALTGADDKGKRLSTALGSLGFQAGDAAKVIKLLQVQSGVLVSDGLEPIGSAAYDAAAAQAKLVVAMLEQKGVAHDVAVTLVQAGQSATYSGDAADVTKDKTKGWTEENKKLLASIIEVGKQAGNTDIPQIATDYLDGEVAASKFKASLVAQAEAQVGASRASADAASVYDAYLGILENLTPSQQAQLAGTEANTAAIAEQQQVLNETGSVLTGYTQANLDAAGSTETFADSQARLERQTDTNKDAQDKLAKSLDKTSSAADLARQAADDLDDALRQVFGGAEDLETANRNLQAGFDDVTASIKENGNTLDIGTEKGRANRAAIQDQVDVIKEKIKADVASGVSIADATNAGVLYRQQLIDTAVQTGLSRDAAEAYVDQLGLTPENVTTAVNLANDEASKKKIQDMLALLPGLDVTTTTQIQALVDQGKFNEAQRLLDNLAQSRNVVYNPVTNRLPLSGGKGYISAGGNYFRAGMNAITSIAEPGAGDEVVLPLDQPGRIRALAAQNNVGSRILDALGNGSSTTSDTVATSTSSASTSWGAALHVEHLTITNDTSAQSLAAIVAFKLAGI